jgi:hypothetical protein
VQYVPTRTAGVMFVVVRPSTSSTKRYAEVQEPGDGVTVNPDSNYLLICDARRPDGMHCEMATEVALRKFSATPPAGAGAPTIDEGIGTVPDISIEHKTTPQGNESAGPAPPPPPPPPAPPAPVAPAATAPAPTPPGGKK